MAKATRVFAIANNFQFKEDMIFMVDKNIKIPSIYQEMSERGYLTKPNYLGIWGMHWMSVDKILQYEYHEYGDFTENKTIIPFAHTGTGDYWLWVPNGENKEYCVGLWEHPEDNGTYFAKNTEDAIFRQIIEYVSFAGFYIDKSQAQSYESSENELMQRLEKYERCFQGILNEEYLNVISQLRRRKLQHVKNRYCEWALLDEAECDALIKKYINFELLGQEFPWLIEK